MKFFASQYFRLEPSLFRKLKLKVKKSLTFDEIISTSDGNVKFAKAMPFWLFQT